MTKRTKEFEVFYDDYQGIEHILIEYDDTEILKTFYTLGPGVDEIISKTTSADTTYYHYDGLGSVIALTDESGTLIGTYAYDTFGKIKTQPTGIDNQVTYAGREYDADSGLYYYRARHYDSEVGRFMQVDPLLLGMSRVGCCNVLTETILPNWEHPYVYCANNSVNYTDPEGKFIYGWYKCIKEMKAWAKKCYANVPKCGDPCLDAWELAQCFMKRNLAIKYCASESKKMFEKCLEAIWLPLP